MTYTYAVLLFIIAILLLRLAKVESILKEQMSLNDTLCEIIRKAEIKI